MTQLVLESALQCIRSNTRSSGGDDEEKNEGGLDVTIEEPFTDAQLNDLVVNNDHFLHGLSNSNPSSLRESAVEVPDTSWADIGGLEKTKWELQVRTSERSEGTYGAR